MRQFKKTRQNKNTKETPSSPKKRLKRLQCNHPKPDSLGAVASGPPVGYSPHSQHRPGGVTWSRQLLPLPSECVPSKRVGWHRAWECECLTGQGPRGPADPPHSWALTSSSHLQGAHTLLAKTQPSGTANFKCLKALVLWLYKPYLTGIDCISIETNIYRTFGPLLHKYLLSAHVTDSKHSGLPAGPWGPSIHHPSADSKHSSQFG